MQHTRRGIWRIGGALALALALGAGCRSREDGAGQGAGQGAETITGTAGTATKAVPGPRSDTEARRPDAPAPVVTDISADLAPLRNRFQHDDGLVRVIMLVAPT